MEQLKQLEKIFEWNLPPTAQSLVNVVLIWVGFAIIVGIVARAFIPARITKGPLVTLLVGLTGSCLGPLAVSCCYSVDNFNPIGVVGFLVSVLAAIGVLFTFHFFLLIFPVRTKSAPANEEKSPNEDNSTKNS